MRRGSAGFTVLEVLVALGVLAIAMAMVATSVQWALKAQWEAGKDLPVAVAGANLDRVLYPLLRASPCIVGPALDSTADTVRAYQDCDCTSAGPSCHYVVFCLTGNTIRFARGTGAPPPTDCSAATVSLVPDWAAATEPSDGQVFRRSSTAPNVLTVRVQLSTAPTAGTTWIWQKAIPTQAPVQ